MKITVRPYKKEDAERLMMLYLAAGCEADAKKWARTFLGRRAFVAEICGELAGFGEIDIDISCTACSSGKITRLCVSSEYRKMGIGRAILTEIEQYAQKNAVGVMGVWSPSKTKPFFEKWGYTAVCEEDGLCLLRKRL